MYSFKGETSTAVLEVELMAFKGLGMFKLNVEP